MNRNYAAPTVAKDWASSRETHIAVATAIHAIAGPGRSADTIWEAPTAAEWDHVCMAVEEYIRNGDFPAEPDGQYSWGEETVDGPATFKLYWVRADEQGSYDMGSYESREAAEAAIPSAQQELLEQQGEQDGRNEIEAGRWNIEAE